MREIVLDTETTGLYHTHSDRIIQIGLVELWDYCPTGTHKQWTINPERPIPAEVSKIHNLTDEIVSTKPRFIEIVDEFLEFIGDSALIIHNARFDIGFLNAELRRVNYPLIGFGRVIDTMDLVRKRHPGMKLSLDALCVRFGILNSNRTVHGALLDAELLAECYLELRGGRQKTFDMSLSHQQSAKPIVQSRQRYPLRPRAPSDEERKAHEKLVDEMSNALWKQVKSK